MQSIYHRRSIRKFQNKNIPKDILEQILNAGRAAPSAKNRQPWKYIVFGGIQKQELLNAMASGLQREEQGRTDLPQSRYGLPDAGNTLNCM